MIVERADRFGRNDTEALRAIDELHEFGVAVRFANSPDLDQMDPDDRVIVTLSFTLARRETALLGIRVKGTYGRNVRAVGSTDKPRTATTMLKHAQHLTRKNNWDVLLVELKSIRNAIQLFVRRGTYCLKIN